VEAALTLPFFVSFLLLIIFFIKLASISIALDHAVSETAKQLAAASYPLSILNEFEDELAGEQDEYHIPSFKEELENIRGYIMSGAEDLLFKLLSGNIDKKSLDEFFETLTSQVENEYKRGIVSLFVDRYGSNYFQLKTRLKYSAVWRALEKFFQNGLVEKDKVELLLAELPRSFAEYRLREEDEEYLKLCNELNVIPERNDVVIAVQYRIRLPLPFFSREYVLRHMAVERAWMNGSNGVYSEDFGPGSKTDRETEGEGSDDSENGNGQSENGENGSEGNSDDNSGNDEDNQNDDDGNGGGGNHDEGEEENQRELVYVTRTGTRYHREDCDYLFKSKIPMKLEDAKNKGYIPCKVCVTKTAKPIGRRR